MTNDEIIKKAGSDWQKERGAMRDYLEIIIGIVRKDEKEECAKLVDKMMGDWQLGKEVAAVMRGDGK